MNNTDYYFYGGEDADKNTLQVGFYEVDREGKTYKSIQEVKGVERVLTDLNLCWGRGRPSDPVRIPLKMRAGSYVKKNTLYYVESAEFESGTAIIYYPTQARRTMSPTAPCMWMFTFRARAAFRHISPWER